MIVTRRRALWCGASLATAALHGTRDAGAFGESGAFNPRLLVSGGRKLAGSPRFAGAGRWSMELIRRTSAPARQVVSEVLADRPELWSEPFAVWAGDSDIGSLSNAELRGLSRFFKLGGLLLVDDSAPGTGAFGRAARRELARVLPEAPPVHLDSSHVVFKSYYLLDRPVGRVLGSSRLEAIARGKTLQVIFSDVDLLGALAHDGQSFTLEVQPGGAQQREYAIRLAVNLAMYVLCSDYKDDQVHASWLMRRRPGRR
ncbi:MAG TPA: DUF4159 domain-containing protein [Polyangiaceae bacterium]|nr:DUF4159 domain-containing protein [Polyangiaceae bacterium]